MQSFKFVETFFILSLGVTFALIITLVYHFKKRMENMETKCDTMFDIVQNLAKEVLEFKQNAHVEQHMVPMQMEQVAYDTLDDVVHNNINENHYDSVKEESDEESDEESGEESGEDDVLQEKITIPDDGDDTRVIDLSDPVIQLSPPSDEPLAISEFIDEDETVPTELNIDELLNVNKLDDDTNIDADDSIEGNLSKSALRKLKLADLKQMATDKQHVIDDSMTKNAIIDILLAN